MIYLDNAATTPIRGEVINAMMKYITDNYANPSSIYSSAMQAKMAMDIARAQVAAAINAKPAEIFFTGSGSEAVNWAIKGIVEAITGGHIITTNVEHHAALHACGALERQGHEVTYLPVDEFGMVTAEQVVAAVRPHTVLVSIMMANNEVGSIMPIAEIGAYLASLDHKVHFFTDAIQAVGAIPVDVGLLGVDMLAVSGHKLYGPKGVGALYIKGGTKIAPLIHGGGQERGRRGGTENVAGIVGMGLAAELAMEDLASKSTKNIEMRDWLIAQILERIPCSRLNGHPVHRLPNNVNISFECIEGEGILLLLDSKGIAASSGSACTSGSLDPSHVLLAMGLPHETAHGSLRLTFGCDTTQDELNELMEVLPGIVSKLRQISPLWKGGCHE